MSTPEKSSPGANAQEEKPRLTEEQKRQNHISSGECRVSPSPAFLLSVHQSRLLLHKDHHASVFPFRPAIVIDMTGCPPPLQNRSEDRRSVMASIEWLPLCQAWRDRAGQKVTC